MDSAVVKEDVPPLTQSLGSGIHHVLQLPQELDERLLSSCLESLGEQDLTKHNINSTYASYAPGIPKLGINSDPLFRELPYCGIIGPC